MVTNYHITCMICSVIVVLAISPTAVFVSMSHPWIYALLTGGSVFVCIRTVQTMLCALCFIVKGGMMDWVNRAASPCVIQLQCVCVCVRACARTRVCSSSSSSMYCTRSSIVSTLYSMYCTRSSLLSTLYSMYCTRSSILSTLSSMYCVLPLSLLGSLHLGV